MKKVIVTLLVLMLVLGITACNSPEEREYERALAEFEETVGDIIKEEFGCELTELRFNENLTELHLTYNTRCATKDEIEAEAYCITIMLGVACDGTGLHYAVDITAVDYSGREHHTYTSYEDMMEIVEIFLNNR